MFWKINLGTRTQLGLLKVSLTSNVWASPHEKMTTRAKTFSAEFQNDVMAVARRNEAPSRQIAKDSGASPTRVTDGLEEIVSGQVVARR